MQNEMKDNEKFVENDELPVLETPHFNDEEIAQAKRVQPLAQLNQRRMASTPRVVSLMAMIVAGLLVTAALGIGLVNSNSLLRSASDDGAAPSEIATTKQSTADESQDVSDNGPTRVYQRRKFSNRRFERPRLVIKFSDSDDRRPKARLVSVIP